MKSYTFFIISFLCLSLQATAQDEQKESSYSLVRSKGDAYLKPGQSSFCIHFSNSKGNFAKEIVIIDNGIEKHVQPDEKGNVIHVTKPGKHILKFIVGDEYFPIVTDELYSIEYHQNIMEVVFKSSVLITFKE